MIFFVVGEVGFFPERFCIFFFGPERLRNFFRPKRLIDFFFAGEVA